MTLSNPRSRWSIRISCITSCAPNRTSQSISMSAAHPRQCALGRSAEYPRSRSRCCCTRLRTTLLTHNGGVPRGAAAANESARELRTLIISGRILEHDRPAVRGSLFGNVRRTAKLRARRTMLSDATENPKRIAPSRRAFTRSTKSSFSSIASGVGKSLVVDHQARSICWSSKIRTKVSGALAFEVALGENLSTSSHACTTTPSACRPTCSAGGWPRWPISSTRCGTTRCRSASPR